MCACWAARDAFCLHSFFSVNSYHTWAGLCHHTLCEWEWMVAKPDNHPRLQVLHLVRVEDKFSFLLLNPGPVLGTLSVFCPHLFLFCVHSWPCFFLYFLCLGLSGNKAIHTLKNSNNRPGLVQPRGTSLLKHKLHITETGQKKCGTQMLRSTLEIIPSLCLPPRERAVRTYTQAFIVLSQTLPINYTNL